MKGNKLLTLFLGLSIFVLLPFVYTWKLQDIEQSPRFFSLGLIVTIGAVISFFYNQKHPPTFPGNKLFIVILLFFSIHCLQFLRSINFGDGLFELIKVALFYCLLFLFIVSLFSNKENKFLLIKSIAFSALILIGFGLSQLYPAIQNYFKYETQVFINYELSSTLGNKNFFAETLLLMLPIVLMGSFYQTRIWRIFFLITAFLIFLTLVILQTFSTWVALSFMIVMATILTLVNRQRLFQNNKSIRQFYLICGGAVAGVILTVSIFIHFTGTENVKTRLLTFRQLFDDSPSVSGSVPNSTYERIILWKNALRMISDKPLAGQGLGNYKINSPLYGSGSKEYMTSGVIRFVHPHNDFLFIATELGVAGFIIYLVMFAMLFYQCLSMIKSASSTENIIAGIFLFSSLIGYTIVAMVSLPSNRVFPSILLMFFVAMVISASEKPSSSLISGNTFSAMHVIIFLIGLSALWIGNFRLNGEFDLAKALLLERQKQYDTMGRNLDKINKFYLPVDVTATPIAWYQGYSCFYTGNQENAFEFFKEAYIANPNHLMVLNDLGTCYNLHSDPSTARTYYDKVLAIQPDYGETLINIAILQFNAGNLDSSYIFLIRNKSLIKPDKVPVYKTILKTKAEAISSDSLTLSAFESRLNNGTSLMQVIREINDHHGDLRLLLK